jgi:hypothetical protein
MDLRKLMPVLVLALAGMATACGNKCKSLCEDGKDCADATAAAKAEDCDKNCSDLDDLSDSADCGSQKDDWLSCEDDIDDICKPPANACEKEGTALFTCLGTYCAAHTTDTKCSEFAASGS